MIGRRRMSKHAIILSAYRMLYAASMYLALAVLFRPVSFLKVYIEASERVRLGRLKPGQYLA